MPSVLITGASTGIGRACALALDKKGYSVFAGVRKEADGEELKKAASPKLRYLILDVTNEKQIAAAAEQISRECPEGLNALVNNAGIVMAGPLEFIPLEGFRKQFEVNVTGLLSTTQKFLPLLRKTKGRIINIGSVSGRVSYPFVGSYCASKHAVEALSDTLRIELAPFDIKVILIEPGPIKTPIWEKSMQTSKNILRDSSNEAQKLYPNLMKIAHREAMVSSRSAIPAERVVQSVLKALELKHPRARYLVGLNAHLQVFTRFILPTKVFDWIIVQGIKWGGRDQSRS